MSAQKTTRLLALGALLAASLPALAHHDPRHGSQRPGHPVFDRGHGRHVVVEQRPRHVVIEHRPRHAVVEHYPVHHVIVEHRRPKHKHKHHVVVERPVYLERHVVIEQPVYIERRPVVVHAPAPVYGPPPVVQRGHGVNVVGAAAGAAIGAVIGSQVGHGRDRTATTAAGAAIGGVIGSQF